MTGQCLHNKSNTVSDLGFDFSTNKEHSYQQALYHGNRGKKAS